MGRQWFLFLLGLSVAKGGLLTANLSQYKNVTVADTNTICSNFRTISNVSEKCADQLEIVCGNTNLLLTCKYK